MKTVNIAFPFTLTHPDGKLQEFKPGEQEVEDHLADHWYVQAHSTTPPKYEPKPGTPEAAKEAAKKIQRRKILEAASELGDEE